MKLNKPFKEIIIVVSVFVLLWAVSFFLMGPLLGNSTLDINMHDTYHIVGSVWSNSVLPAFLWLNTIGYIIRAALYKFKDRIQNLILLTGCAGLNLLTLYYLKETARFAGFSSHFYQTSPSPLHSPKTNMPYENMLQTSFVIQVILIFLLAIIAAITARNWNTKKHAF